MWSFISGQRVQEIPLGRGALCRVAFPGPHRLLLALAVSREATMQIWDATAGAIVKEFAVKSESIFGADEMCETLAVTPGGKYAAMMDEEKLLVYDLSEGRLVGERELPEKLHEVYGLAFSTEGAELACLGRGRRDRLLVWDLDNGRLIVDEVYSNTLPNDRYRGSLLEWIPDNSGLIYAGRTLLDGQTGAVVWTLPRPDNGSPRKMIAPDRLLVPMSKGRRVSLSLAQLPTKDITAAFAAVRSGGEAVDAVLPPITTANTFAARSLSLPDGVTPWKAVPDGTPALSAVPRSGLLLAKENEEIKAMTFASGDPAKLVVCRESRAKAATGQAARTLRLVRRVDVETGSVSSDVELPHVYSLIDVSPSGDFALVGFADRNGDFDRLDVVGLSPKKHIVGWRPLSSVAN